MNSRDPQGRLCPLPIRPRPAAGEPTETYIRRLALANHLRPSYLRGYLAGPPRYLGAIRPERLAALSGRTIAVLERTLTGLARHTRPAAQPQQPARPRRRRVQAADKPALFAAIRRAAQDGDPIRTIAARHRVHRRMIRQALADPTPPPRKQPQRASALDRLRGPITTMLTTEPDLTIRQIWERLLDDHDTAISYDRVHQFIVRLRPANPGHARQAPPQNGQDQLRQHPQQRSPELRRPTEPAEHTSQTRLPAQVNP